MGSSRHQAPEERLTPTGRFRFFRPPRFRSQRDNVASHLLNALFWIAILAVGVSEVFQVATGAGRGRILAVGFVTLLAIIGQVALRRRHLGLAAHLAAALVFVAASLSLWLAGRIDAPGASIYLLVLVAAGVALSARQTAAWTALCLLALSLFAVGEWKGMLPAPEPRRDLLELFLVHALQILAAGAVISVAARASGATFGILEQRDAELAESEERYARLVEQSPDVILALDGSGVVVECSPAAESVFGYTTSQLLGSRFADLVSSGDDGESRALFDAALSGATGALAETRIRHRDGGLRWIESNPRLVRMQDGSTRVYLVIRNTTARHEAEAQRASLEHQLAEARRLEALGRLAGGVAHDFNNLLVVILANCDLLIAGAEVPAEKLVEEIRVAGEEAAGLTAQLLAFSGRHVPQAECVDIVATLRKIDGLLRRLLRANVELQIDLAEEPLPPARGDGSQLQQVLVNLVMNAQQAMPDGGTITAAVSRVSVSEEDCLRHPGASPGPHIRLAIADTGHGMDDETMRHIFEPFYTRGTGGTGLGLATVYGIISQCGGHLRVSSQLGEGTCFEVFLGLAETTSAGTSHEPSSLARPRRDAVVLLVDDEPAVLKSVRRHLEHRGLRVLAVASPDLALSLSRDTPGRIDLLITDVVMPRMTGPELAAELARERPELKVLFVSGYTEDDPGFQQLRRDGFSFVAKPFSGRALERKIDELLGERVEPSTG